MMWTSPIDSNSIIDNQPDCQTDRQTDRQTEILIFTYNFKFLGTVALSWKSQKAECHMKMAANRFGTGNNGSIKSIGNLGKQ